MKCSKLKLIKPDVARFAHLIAEQGVGLTEAEFERHLMIYAWFLMVDVKTLRMAVDKKYNMIFRQSEAA